MVNLNAVAAPLKVVLQQAREAIFLAHLEPFLPEESVKVTPSLRLFTKQPARRYRDCLRSTVAYDGQPKALDRSLFLTNTVRGKLVMKNLFSILVLAFLCCGLATTAIAQSTTQDVTIVIADINEISVSGNLTLTINSATAGSNPDDATDNTTSYSITTNGTLKKITGQLDVVYAAGISLKVNLSAPTGGTSQGQKTLTTIAQDLVTGISGLAESAIQIAYTASATAAVPPNGAGETHTVTFTITA